MTKKIILVVCGVALVAAVVFVFIRKEQTQPEPKTNNNQPAESQQPTKETEEALPQPSYDLTSPSSITFIANKEHPLPANYVPTDLITPDVRLRLAAGAEQMQLRDVAHADLKAMFVAAKADGVDLVFGSGYRSYALQKQFYDSYVARDGVAAADRYSARPGTSEHQTGLAFDVTSPTGTCHLEVCFEDLAEGQWMAKNAYKFGFVLRYPNAKEAVTGYQYEPWHFRFVGKELAAKIYAQDTTLEEYFNLN